MRFLLIVSLCLSINSFSQTLKDWEGDYDGKLVAYSVFGEPKEHRMQLSIHHEKDEVYEWTISYGDSAQDVRAYKMIQMKGNEYQLDEQNGIYIKTMLMDDEMLCLFEVNDSYLSVTYTLLDGQIGVKITSASRREDSGGSMDSDGNVIPIVGSWSMDAVQKGTLSKK